MDTDRVHSAYDADYAHRFFRALVQANRLFEQFRAEFIGKVSPVHSFWGSFDLAVSRFSGRTAPRMTGGGPNVAEWVMAEAYSHETSSCGFWPGNGMFGRPAFFSYVYPVPDGFGDADPGVPQAFYDAKLGLFLLPYDAVRAADDPDAMVLAFARATYAAAADRGGWDRMALERHPAPR